jgi:hypothetical protein
VSAPVFRYASFWESSNCIHTNRHTGPQGTSEPDFRLNLVSRRHANWAIPRFASAYVRADKLTGFRCGSESRDFLLGLGSRKTKLGPPGDDLGLKDMKIVFIRQDLTKIVEPTKS